MQDRLIEIGNLADKEYPFVLDDKPWRRGAGASSEQLNSFAHLKSGRFSHPEQRSSSLFFLLGFPLLVMRRVADGDGRAPQLQSSTSQQATWRRKCSDFCGCDDAED
jgi:hypothetical protein